MRRGRGADIRIPGREGLGITGTGDLHRSGRKVARALATKVARLGIRVPRGVSRTVAYRRRAGGVALREHARWRGPADGTGAGWRQNEVVRLGRRVGLERADQRAGGGVCGPVGHARPGSWSPMRPFGAG
jgi:hypothetical protein